MQLFYSPGACSLGIHVLLEEIGAPYETALVNLREGEQYKPHFAAINPKGRVPTLRLDNGETLTQYTAISLFVAASHPEANLLPRDPLAAARVIELMDYIVGTLHGQGFRLMFRPQSLGAADETADHARAHGRGIVEKGVQVLAEAIPRMQQTAGAFSLVDAALFYLERWIEAAKIAMPGPVADHLQRMRGRPAVQRVLAAEGIQ